MSESRQTPLDQTQKPDKSRRMVKGSVLVGIGIFVVFAVFLINISNNRKAKLRSLNQLRKIGLANINYSSGAASNLPIGGTTDQEGKPQHGWMTTILPFLGQTELATQIQYEIAWNAPENETVFKTSVPNYLNPGIQSPTMNSGGYALSHYTANSRIFGTNKSLSLTAISAADGLNYTILLGEINANFPAWGSAANMRDPANGLDGGPDHFGSPTGNRVVVIFADGSGKLLNQNIDPQILKAISTPNGGETISPGDF